jgi:uncharacterized protein YcbX
LAAPAISQQIGGNLKHIAVWRTHLRSFAGEQACEDLLSEVFGFRVITDTPQEKGHQRRPPSAAE